MGECDLPFFLCFAGWPNEIISDYQWDLNREELWGNQIRFSSISIEHPGHNVVLQHIESSKYTDDYKATQLDFSVRIVSAAEQQLMPKPRGHFSTKID